MRVVPLLCFPYFLDKARDRGVEVGRHLATARLVDGRRGRPERLVLDVPVVRREVGLPVPVAVPLQSGRLRVPVRGVVGPVFVRRVRRVGVETPALQGLVLPVVPWPVTPPVLRVALGRVVPVVGVVRVVPAFPARRLLRQVR